MRECVGVTDQPPLGCCCNSTSTSPHTYFYTICAYIHSTSTFQQHAWPSDTIHHTCRAIQTLSTTIAVCQRGCCHV